MSPNVYLLEKKDIPEVLPLLRKFQEEHSPWESFVDEVASRNLELLAFDDKGILLAAVQDNSVVGVLAATKTQSLFSYETHTQELAFFVEPEYRKSKIAATLFSLYEKWAEGVADGTGAHCIDERVGKLYERKGYHRVETGYFKRNK